MLRLRTSSHLSHCTVLVNFIHRCDSRQKTRMSLQTCPIGITTIRRGTSTRTAHSRKSGSWAWVLCSPKVHTSRKRCPDSAHNQNFVVHARWRSSNDARYVCIWTPSSCHNKTKRVFNMTHFRTDDAEVHGKRLVIPSQFTWLHDLVKWAYKTFRNVSCVWVVSM